MPRLFTQLSLALAVATAGSQLPAPANAQEPESKPASRPAPQQSESQQPESQQPEPAAEPDAAEQGFYRAWFLIHQQRKHKAAVPLLRAFLQKHPGHQHAPLAAVELVGALRETGCKEDADQAAARYRKLIEKAPERRGPRRENRPTDPRTMGEEEYASFQRRMDRQTSYLIGRIGKEGGSEWVQQLRQRIHDLRGALAKGDREAVAKAYQAYVETMRNRPRRGSRRPPSDKDDGKDPGKDAGNGEGKAAGPGGGRGPDKR